MKKLEVKVAKKNTPKKIAVKKAKSKNQKVKQDIYKPRLQTRYKDKVLPDLKNRFNYANIMEVPKLVSISINIGIGDGKSNNKGLESAIDELTQITGQKPIITLAKKDISNFKIRKGWPVGCKVTLRATKMFEFLDRLISVALPRTRDFRGLSFKAFDGRGNYNFGIEEQIIFTEIDYDKIESIRGLNITIVTTADSDDEAYWLLKGLGLPMREKPQKIEEAA